MFNPLRYPKSGVISPQRGLNVFDNLFQVGAEWATILKNLLWVGDSLLERYPFRPFSTTDFSAEGVFRGAHDYRYPGGNARFLFATNSGKIKERTAINTEADRVTGLATDQEIHFSTVYDAVVAVNGVSTPRVGRDTTWRQWGSPAAVSNLAVNASGAGAFTGDRLHIVIPVIEVGGISVVFANWSNLTKTTAAGNAQFNLTWTDVVDSRITAYLVFGSELGRTTMHLIARVATGVGAYTDTTADASLPVVVSGQPSTAPLRNSWGVPPVSKYIAFAGNRVVYANLGGVLSNAIQCGRFANTSYEAEGCPPADTPDSGLVRMLKDGDVTAVFPIGETGEGAARANHVFVAQESACYILPEANPSQPLQIISSDIGCIGQRAIAQFEESLFWQSRRGVEYWPGVGQKVYLISDKINPIFTGGGNQGLSPNQADSDITYCVAKNQLWITIRDSGAAAGGNKAYCLDLLKFKREFNPFRPASSARFSGPQENAGLGLALLKRRLDGTLIALDNQNSRLLFYDEDESQDTIDGTATDIPVIIQHGAIMREDPIAQKVLHYAHVLQFTGSNTILKILMEFERVTAEATAQANTYTLEWDDLEWADLSWLFDTWYSETPFEFGTLAGKWFVPRIEKEDSRVDFAYFGLVFWYSAFSQIRTFR